jgi:NAD-dependent SIR2 family protein deacetylase
MLGRVLLKPDLMRQPVYDSVSNLKGRFQAFNCIKCNHSVPIDFTRYISQPADPESALGTQHAAEVREHFGILERSLENGWPKVRVEVCGKCDTRYLVYVAEFEPRNSWCQGVLQGITELLPSN